MQNTFKKICEVIASCGMNRNILLAEFFGSLLALPLLFLFKGAHNLSDSFSYALLVIFFSVGTFALLVTAKTAYEPPVLVIDKIMGLLCVFVHIPLSVRLVVAGVIIFHAVRELIPLLCEKFFDFNLHDRIGLGVNELCLSMAAGIMTNGMLHFMFWVTQ